MRTNDERIAFARFEKVVQYIRKAPPSWEDAIALLRVALFWPLPESITHHEGIEAENAVNGTVRGPQKVVSATQHPDGTLDATVEVPYTYPDGKVVTTTLTIVNNDVTRSEDQVTTTGEAK